MPETTRVFHANAQLEGEGMEVRRAIPNHGLPRIDPFLLLDHMGPTDFGPGEGKGAPDHPHRGFETVTYVLEGKMQHRDSQGNKGDLRAGDVQWMTAGAGLVHSELPHPDLQATGGRLHGLQLWVNLPREDKMSRPRYQDIAAETIPVVDVPGGKVRVIAGRVGDTTAVIDTRTPIEYLHVELEGGAHWSHQVPRGHNGFCYVIRGAGTIRDAQAKEGDLVVIPDGQKTTIEAAPGGDVFSVLLVDGKPLGEPVVNWGPFVMNTREEILEAIRDYETGRFGTIAPQVD